MITVSLVSHGHGEMVSKLVHQLIHYRQIEQIVLTLNIPENIDLPEHPKIKLIRNKIPRGFGSNHNIAFQHSQSEYFCVINPDIIFKENCFPNLISTLSLHGATMVAPRVKSPQGHWEDSIRIFPSVKSLVSKALFDDKGIHKIPENCDFFAPNWVAGMFMLFRSKEFSAIDGFDTDYFLYYEDVDLCARLHKTNRLIIVDTRSYVIHNAQRNSHKNFKHMLWHCTSLIRYLWRHGTIKIIMDSKND